MMDGNLLFLLTLAAFVVAVLTFVWPGNQLSNRWRYAIGGGFLVCAMVLAGYLGISIYCTFNRIACSGDCLQTIGPSASLTGLKVKIADYRSSLVDLRTVSDSGVSVKPGDKLQISDVLAFVSDDWPEYDVHLEMYAAPDLKTRIGATAAEPMLAGTVELGAVAAEGDDAIDDKQWVVPSGWSQSPLFAALIAERRGYSETVMLQKVPVRLELWGRSWFQDPPYGQIADFAYTVNSGPAMYVDLPAALEKGIDAGPGDQFSLVGIWYRGVMDGKNIQIEADIQNGDEFDPATFLETPYEPMRDGLNPISIVSELKWTIPDGQRTLVLQLWRDDNLLLDTLALKFAGAQGASGVVNAQDAVIWPATGATYVDLEKPSELAEWEPVTGTATALSSSQSFSGGSSLAITRTESAIDPDTLLLRWRHPFQARLIVGQVYWTNVGMPVWAQVCLDYSPHCYDILDKGTGNKWQSFAIDLTAVCAERNSAEECTKWEDLSDNRYDGLYFQGEVHAAPNAPYTFYLDGIQVYRTE